MENAFKEFNGTYLIWVSKKDFNLKVCNRNGNVVARYKIGYGKNPDLSNKLHAGDDRTPEGTYRVCEILSMDAAKNSTAYKKLKEMNTIYFRASEGHSLYGRPEVDLGYNAYGPRFFRIDYPNKNDLERYKKNIKKGIIKAEHGSLPGIGSGIAVHGNADEKSIGYPSSSGCIRMYNRDIVELDSYIILGTPVIISDD